eukprot:NODE_3180_length_696_cov_217.853168_g2257_i0.p1 GENE.NODE_3180_length_696_cov_217.853168_g2257_i0~~NODE_3180_length_696_cov_217.853168_g2257_i0.p1  ORF type:complete len:99 (-),score=14.07 NODE_3180_length_696_cov_217.853168_g2257_i0:106-402(-)
MSNISSGQPCTGHWSGFEIGRREGGAPISANLEKVALSRVAFDGSALQLRIPAAGGSPVWLQYGFANLPQCLIYDAAGWPALPVRLRLANVSRPLEGP